MVEWVQQHEQLLVWLGGLSVLLFVGTLLMLPVMVVRIPADYFRAPKRPRHPRSHPRAHMLARIAKSVLGVIFILAGLAMLVLPGQGLLTIAVGVILLEFPGKRRLERWVILRRGVLRSINWLRRRAKHEPLVVDRVEDERL